MVQIMEELHSYVPAKRYNEDLSNEDSEEAIQVPNAVIHPILFGGDQLTAARARGAKSAKINSYDPFKRLDGLIPIAEDWHTKLNFLGVRKFITPLLHFHSTVSPSHMHIHVTQNYTQMQTHK